MLKFLAMKKVTFLLSLLYASISFAQEKDSIQTNTLGEVLINGKYYKKYLEKEGSSSLRLDEELIKIPQNVSIITNSALVDQQITTLSDGVLRNVAGAQRLEHWGDMYTRVNMRGSRAAAFLNGVNVTSNWGPLSEDMSFVNHIEFVKGPSGFLMSNGEPSGIYNIVTKKPTGNRLNGSARFTTGSFDMYRGEIDVDSKLNDKIAFRLNLMGQNRKSFRDYEFNDRYIVNPSFKFQLSDKTVLTTEYIFQKAKMSEVGSAYVYTFDGYGTKPREYTVSDPNIDPTKIENHTVNINLQHQFNKNWKLTSQLSYINEYTMGSDIWPGTFNTDGTMIRGLYFWEASNDMAFGQTFLNGFFKTGKVSHKTLIGLDTGIKKYQADWLQGGELDTHQNPFNTNSTTYSPPSKGYPVFDASKPLSQRANPYGTIKQNYSGIYIQDELGFFDDALRLTLAARYTNVSQTSYGAAEEKADKITPRVGISYSLDKNTSFYALFDQSFVPQTGLFRDGSTAVPLTGSNYEIGFKRDWLKGKWNTTLSLYNIDKNNAIASDPDETDNPNGKYSILLGKTRAQGVEFDLKGEVVKGLNVILNYAFTENKYTETTALHQKGELVPGYSKHTANGWVNYTFSNGFLQGFGLSFGGTFLADRSTWDWGNTDSPLQMEDYVKFDAGLFWGNKKINVNLNVFNVFDRYLYSGSAYRFLQTDGSYKSGYYYQAEAPRNWRLSIGYKF